MQRVIIVILAVMVTLPVILKSRVSGNKSASAPAAFSVISSARVMVRVSGDVRHSGIYEVSANELAESVINLAEANSIVKRFEPTGIGALPVVNGLELHLKMEPGGIGIITVGSIPASERIILRIPLDINSMSEADFDRLPGIGPVMARRIVEYRQNNGGRMRLIDLLAVEGIGEIKYQKLCKYF